MAPREGLESCVGEDGPCQAPFEPRCRPQAGKSGDPRSQNTDKTLAQARFAAIFDLLAQSTSHKTPWGDCSLVCDSSIGPISFCSGVLFIANFFCLGDPILELACQIYVIPSSFDA